VLDGESIKVWSASVQAGSPQAVFGTILAVAPEGIAVAAMNSIVILKELQRAGSKRMPVADFVRGFPLQAGQVLA
jgi:methionyl-tRNA formyltransferase